MILFYLHFPEHFCISLRGFFLFSLNWFCRGDRFYFKTLNVKVNPRATESKGFRAYLCLFKL